MDINSSLTDAKYAVFDANAFPSYEAPVSDQMFNSFHKIDRTLFYRLTRKLGRNIAESMRVVAFFIWVERVRYSRDPVRQVISWPFEMVNQVAVEVAKIFWLLDCIQLPLEYIHVPLIRRLCHKHIDLTDFHQRRIEITESINKIVEEVCIRACRDIIMDPSTFVDEEGEQLWQAYINPPVFVPPPPPYQANAAAAGFQVVEQFAGNLGFPQTGFQGNVGPLNFMGPQNIASPQNVVGLPHQEVLDDPEDDLSEMLLGLALLDDLVNDTADVPPEDRTLFLTFSKGYYIPEEEIRDFFTSLFGDFIEEMYMQEVPQGVQPLYARMVCRSAATVYVVAPDGEKTKYSIRGRHVWAKKYEP